MKMALGLALILTASSMNSWAQAIDYDKRNLHIFCNAHLTLMSESPNIGGDQQEALVFLANMHREEAGKLGATGQHYRDVTAHLEKMRNNNPSKWERLSRRGKQVCLPDV